MKYFAALALGTALSAPAFAGGPIAIAPEPVVAAPVIEEQPSLGGDWGGFYAGAQLGYGDVDSNGGGLDGDGLLGGVHAGYRYDFGKTVIGAELDYDSANIDLGETAVGSLNSVARLKLMAGADLGRTLIYGTAGVAYADATVGSTDFNDNGYFAGVGVDYALTDMWTVGGEVLQHKFSDFDATGIDLDATTVKAKVSYNF